MKREPSGIVMILAICAAALFTATSAIATPTKAPFSQCSNLPCHLDFNGNPGPHQLDGEAPKIGGIIEGYNLIWGENTGWASLGAAHADFKIGANILSGWIWLENCGWVRLGDGHPLDGKRYANRGAHDWGINNDGHGNLSGYAWSEVTGWISFRTAHSRVYLDDTGRFYGYAWGENVGWMHFGPGRTVQYLAKADPGPWKKIGKDGGSRLAGSPDDSEMSNGSVPATGLNSNSERYNKDAWTVYSLKLGRDDSCASFRCCDTPVYISSLAKLSRIRAPPAII
ncbi:MAG: hypothetical protein NTZ78_12110 [Candidatus Aureabacteria bacterium]|nr:hypothetical protein [Candidatus Auribacterota bacterium]